MSTPIIRFNFHRKYFTKIAFTLFITIDEHLNEAVNVLTPPFICTIYCKIIKDFPLYTVRQD